MAKTLTIRGNSFAWGSKTYLMGILNVTPDSFSDGGEFNHPQTALSQAQLLESGGADIIDVGGQSTRPGAEQISLSQELERVVSVIELIRSKIAHLPISVDTTRAEVAKAAIEAGADLVNDISGATFDDAMLATVAKLDVPIVLMHIRGNPQTMQSLTNYDDLLGEICQFLAQRITLALEAGIKAENIIIDPGIGFAKTHTQNLELLRRLPELQSLGTPILVGASRKSFIGNILNRSEPKDRVWGTAAACCRALASGADILRVHDVPPMADVCRVADALWR